MKKTKIIFNCVILLAFISFTFSSCEDYLNKAPASDITESDVFHDFTSMQGFIEQCYNCIVDPDKAGSPNNYSFGDEVLRCNSDFPFDTGNWWGSENYFYGQAVNITDSRNPRRRIWESAWYGIRVANMALENLEIEDSGLTLTDEERKLIKGQALFFRGWFYFQICRYWGGMPYVTHVIAADEDMFSEEFYRTSAKESFIRMANDFRAAADLLPNHWDETVPGRLTEGHNNRRINKFFALGYLGEALLFAASPMLNEEATGKNEFDADLCRQSAEAFGELLKLSDETNIYYLESWDRYMDIFTNPNRQPTGGKEVIMNPTPWYQAVRWSTLGGTCPVTLGMNSGTNQFCPTHNIIQNFGMANGLPLDDPASGYNPEDPWTGREPRFYKLVVYDGSRISNYTDKRDQYAELFNGGRHRAGGSYGVTGSATGYYLKKFNLLGPTFTTSLADVMQEYVPYLRMADIYLMYAEAVNWMTGGGPTASASSYSMTALDAINAVRTRAQIPELTPSYYASKEVFFEAIVRERAVELILEAKRFDDLRRWNRIADPRYLNKTAIDFNRAADGKPVNISERIVITRVASSPKMNWLPIQIRYTTQFEGFLQNPGW